MLGFCSNIEVKLGFFKRSKKSFILKLIMRNNCLIQLKSNEKTVLSKYFMLNHFETKKKSVFFYK